MIKWITLTADDTVTLGMKHKVGEVVLVAKGDFGGGALSYGYEDQSKNYAPLADLTTLTAAGERAVTFGSGMILMAQLAGATTPSVEIGVAADFFTEDEALG